MSATLSDREVADYERDGYVILREFFSKDEVRPLIEAYREDPSINGSLYGMADKDGNPHPINIWTELEDDIIGMIPRMTRIRSSRVSTQWSACGSWDSGRRNSATVSARSACRWSTVVSMMAVIFSGAVRTLNAIVLTAATTLRMTRLSMNVDQWPETSTPSIVRLS